MTTTDLTAAPVVVTDDLQAARARQSHLLELLPADAIDQLRAYHAHHLVADAPPYAEIALRDRVDELLADPVLAAYVDRCRRDRNAAAREAVIDANYSELAGDAAVAMDEELALCGKERYRSVAEPSDDEWSALSRLVPLLSMAAAFSSTG
jgi:hypothetical protein